MHAKKQKGASKETRKKRKAPAVDSEENKNNEKKQKTSFVRKIMLQKPRAKEIKRILAKITEDTEFLELTLEDPPRFHVAKDAVEYQREDGFDKKLQLQRLFHDSWNDAWAKAAGVGIVSPFFSVKVVCTKHNVCEYHIDFFFVNERSRVTDAWIGVVREDPFELHQETIASRQRETFAAATVHLPKDVLGVVCGYDHDLPEDRTSVLRVAISMMRNEFSLILKDENRDNRYGRYPYTDTVLFLVNQRSLFTRIEFKQNDKESYLNRDPSFFAEMIKERRTPFTTKRSPLNGMKFFEQLLFPYAYQIEQQPPCLFQQAFLKNLLSMTLQETTAVREDFGSYTMYEPTDDFMLLVEKAKNESPNTTWGNVFELLASPDLDQAQRDHWILFWRALCRLKCTGCKISHGENALIESQVSALMWFGPNTKDADFCVD